MNARNSLVRSVTFLATSVGLVVGSLSFIAGCSSVPPAPGDGGDGTNGGPTSTKFAGADTCMPCHSGMHANWQATPHATALGTLEAIGQGENAACLGCHTVGFNDDGFVSRAETPALAGVQCENCHGASADHAANPGDLAIRPFVDLSAALCGTCHTDAHHPTFDEWQHSKHATALEGLRSNPFAQDTCLKCHSQDYRHAVEEQEGESGVVVPTLATAQLSIECATCHAPHGGVAQDHQLRQPIASLCGECHTQEEAELGDTPHHPQLEMLTGIGAFDADGSGLELTHVHSGLAASGGAACAQCHVVGHEVEEPNEGNPNVTGHTFNPFDSEITAASPEHQAEQYTGCRGCHTDSVANELRVTLQTDLAARLDALAPFFDVSSTSFIDADTLSAVDQARLATAKFDFQFVAADGSNGVHNPALSRGALDVAEQIVNDLTGQ